MNLILFELIPFFIPLDKKINQIKDSSLEEKKNQSMLIYHFIKENNGFISRVCNLFSATHFYFCFNSKDALENPFIFLFSYYIYSFLQNAVYFNFKKVKKAAFRTRLSKKKNDLEFDILLETRVYQVIYFYLKNLKVFSKRKKKKRIYERN